MQKIFVESNQIQGDNITIVGPDVNHLGTVLRMQKEEKLQICNQDTLENYIVVIQEIEKEKILTKVIEKLETTVEANVKIDLYQGLPKADKMELIIQKTIELGVDSIIPVDMVRCVVKLEEKEAKKKIERWQKIAVSAAKQSKRDKVPTINPKIKLKEVAQKIGDYDVFLIAYEEETGNSLKQELQKIEPKETYKIGILVGPEGGLDEKEVMELKEKGAKVVSLGKRILRTETAPIAMVSNILYELEK